MKYFKYCYLAASILFIVMGIWMLTDSFFSPCNDSQCSFNVGSQAEIDRPAVVMINSNKGFSVEQHKVNGEVVTYDAVKNGFYYVVDIVTDQPTSLFMSEEAGGRDTPYINVSNIDFSKWSDSDYNPRLSVERTWYKPLEQLRNWYGIVPFMLAFMNSVLWFVFFLWYSKRN